MKLLVSLYNEIHPARAQEYLFCLQRNREHPLIDEIHVLYDTSSDGTENILLAALKNTQVSISYVRGRPTYAECFRYANAHFPGEIVILSNGDIFFNCTLPRLSGLNWHNLLLAITRNDWIGTWAEGSADTWIFRTPIDDVGADIQLGTCYCDQVVAYLAYQHGMKVYNPCYAISCVHHHTSMVRNRGGIQGCHSHKETSCTDGLLGMKRQELIDVLEKRWGVRMQSPLQRGGGLVQACALTSISIGPIRRAILHPPLRLAALRRIFCKHKIR